MILLLGNQLFDPRHLRNCLGQEPAAPVFMREDRELCTYFRFHKHKIVFFLSAMRTYRDELENSGFRVHYERLGESGESYESRLEAYILQHRVKRVFHFEIEDKFFEKRITDCLEKLGVERIVWPSPMFLTTRPEFREYLGRHNRPFMKTFYEGQRRRLGILMTPDGPVGATWSFDGENRKALPPGIEPPSLPRVIRSGHVNDVSEICEREFADHPGKAENFWLPVDRAGARRWLSGFVRERLADFGPYEDALPARSDFVFHSVLTPFLNAGLLEPGEVVAACLAQARQAEIPLPSLEGFIRQVIGWREFVRGIYQEFSERQEAQNYWGHHHRLNEVWYGGQTGIPPLDRALERVQRNGYLHHIERLMVIGNFMVLLEVSLKEAHRWFMEMFIDSSDWVMGPNVYGMALFSDGGIFATKPYICGSNYYRKMAGDKAGSWCDEVDGLYWSFIKKHKNRFLRNPRMAMMARMQEKIAPARMKKLETAADNLRKRLVKS